MNTSVPARYRDTHFHREAVRLLPGQFYATNRDLLIVTVLGSCVAACIRDPIAGCGGMNHFMLPGDAQAGRGYASEAARYGINAMELLINALLKRGARRERLEAKVFGGASVVDGMSTMNVGRNNAEFVVEYLQEEGIAPAAVDLGGTHPRKVYYSHADGWVRLKYLRRTRPSEVIDSENLYRSRLHAKRNDDVVMFATAQTPLQDRKGA